MIQKLETTKYKNKKILKNLDKKCNTILDDYEH